MTMTHILPIYVKPYPHLKAFTCPHCDALVEQFWQNLTKKISSRIIKKDKNSWIGCCRNCKKLTIWLANDHNKESTMVYPTGSAEPPNEYMPEDIQKDYCEAREIASLSPRAACVLLRLCIEKICDDQGMKGDSLKIKIKKMMEKGITPKIKDALTSVRLLGNDAAHPREISLADNIYTATTLFTIVNYIVVDIYEKQAKIKKIYEYAKKSKPVRKK